MRDSRGFRKAANSIRLCASSQGVFKQMNAVLIVILRWLHIIPAAIAIGGLIFMRFVLPAATRSLEEEQSREVFLRARRIFKIMLHASILLLINSGAVNSVPLYPQYVEH